MRTAMHRNSRRALRSAALASLESLESRRLLSAGSLDTNFGTGGIVTTSFNGPSQDGVNAVIKDNAGGYVAVGSSSNGATIVRYHGNGSRDTNFGTGGATVINPATMVSAGAVIQDASGGYVIGGQSDSHEGSFVRLNSNGSIDNSFGTGGVTYDGQAQTGIGGLMLDNSDQVVGMVTYDAGTGPFAAVHLNANGTLDTNFGTAGLAS